jgi:hypothetical protein
MRQGLSTRYIGYLSVYIPRMTHICLLRKYPIYRDLAVYAIDISGTYSAPKLTNALPVERKKQLVVRAVEQL